MPEDDYIVFYLICKIYPVLNLSHKKLEVYKISLLMVKEVYDITNYFPKDERFSLINQLRRAAVSVTSNIAEGAARISVREKKRFYEISRASLVEIDTQLEISLLMSYIKREQLLSLEKNIESIFRMLSSLISNLTAKQNPATPH